MCFFLTKLISGLLYFVLSIELKLIFIDRFLFVNEIRSFFYVFLAMFLSKQKHINEFLCLINNLFYLREPSNYSFNKSTSFQITLVLQPVFIFFLKEPNIFKH